MGTLSEVSFGEWLKRQRKAGGWTQQQLALQISCSTSALKKFEAEERRPSAEIVKRLANVFKIRQDEHASFLRFAQGDWRSAPSDSTESVPWQSSTVSARSNLPAAPTSFIGREEELAALCEYLSNPSTRLVTLIGPPGIGKTRLCIETARNVFANFRDGVFFVPLAPIENSNLLASAINQALGFEETGHQSALERLRQGIDQKHMLLVLDNLEHIIEGVAALIEELLLNCPHLKILTTSREALRVPGEWLYNVQTLEIPDEGSGVNPQTASKFPALLLFYERARAVRADFTLDDQNLQAITSICTQLDGLPLAIELIAARIRLMSPESLLARLNDQFTLYADGMRAIPVRQKTLHNAISWSYNLLSEEEQRLFACLSVFSNGFTLEAAEAILLPTVQTKSIFELITSLVDKSLVQHTFDDSNEARFSLLVTIQHFALERLEQNGLEAEVRDRHLAYFLDLAEDADQHMHDAQQLQSIDRIEKELDNLRTALTWAMGKSSPEYALRLATALEAYWFMHANWFEAAKWLDQALSKEWDESSPLEKSARARALYHRASTADALDDMQNIRTYAEAALALCEKLKDPWGIAYSRGLVGLHLSRTGKAEPSRPLLEKSLHEFHQLGDAWGESRTAGWLAGVLWLLGTPEEYLAMQQRAVACARRSGDRERLGGALVGYVGDITGLGHWAEAEKLLQEVERLFTEVGASFRIRELHLLRAPIHLGRGDYQQAKQEASELVQYCLQVGDKFTQAQALNFLVLIAHLENDLSSAVEYAQRSRDLLQAVGTPQFIAMQLVLGQLKYQQGETALAKQYVKDSLELVKTRAARPFWRRLDFILNQVGALFVNKHPELAVQFLALGEAFYKARPTDAWDGFHELVHGPFLSTARTKLNDEQFAEAWESGSHMDPEKALDLALKAVDEL